MTKQILFLCSGNYYRSRFAELYFNALAAEQDLDWHADSRGIIAATSHNPGPISQATLDGLRARNIAVMPPREPMQLTESDVAHADRVIALYDREHRSMLARHFPNLKPPIEFWNIPDLDELPAEQALALLDRDIRALIEELRQMPVVV